MRGDLGRKEILEFINSKVNFNMDEYLEHGTFMEHYNKDEHFLQAHMYIRLDDSYVGTHVLEVVKAGKEEELKAKVQEVNSVIEQFINELANNTEVVPSYERDTFLYFRRVPFDYGIKLELLEQSKAEEERVPAYYVCNHCGKAFRTPRSAMENIGFKEHPYWEEELTSPCCHCGFDEVYEEGGEE